jgi:hypothetical protein
VLLCCSLLLLQVRVPVEEIAQLIRRLVDSAISWEEVAAKYPAQKAAEQEEQQ